MSDIRPPSLPSDPTCYAYRRRVGGPPILCCFGEHEIPERIGVAEPFRGEIVSICEAHADEIQTAFRAMRDQEDESAHRIRCS